MEKYDNKVFWDFCVHFSMQLESSFQKYSCYIPLSNIWSNPHSYKRGYAVN